MEKFFLAVLTLIAFVAMLIGFGVLTAFPVMWLWNYVAAGILNLPRLDFLHAWALLILSGLLFKSTMTVKK